MGGVVPDHSILIESIYMYIYRLLLSNVPDLLEKALETHLKPTISSI